MINSIVNLNIFKNCFLKHTQYVLQFQCFVKFQNFLLKGLTSLKKKVPFSTASRKKQGTTIIHTRQKQGLVGQTI